MKNTKDGQEKDQSQTFENMKKKESNKDTSTISTNEPSIIKLNDPQREVSIHFPNPVSIDKLVEEMSKWTGICFIFDPSLNQEIQIFSPKPIALDKAFAIFVGSIESLNLRLVQIDEQLIKVVKKTPTPFET